MKQVTISCPLCGSDNYEIFSKRNHKGHFIKIADKYYHEDHVFCNDCGLVYINPVMDQTSLDEFYYRDYREIYRDEDHSEYELSQACPRVMFLEKILPKDRNNILDVGSSMGFFPYLLRNCEFRRKLANINSIEPNDRHVKFAARMLSIQHIHGTIENLDFKLNKKYEVITIFDCFEHLLDPGKFLAKARELLIDDGVIYLELPSIFLPRIHSLAMFSAAHVIMYSEETIEFMLMKHGFYVEYMDFDGNGRDMRIVAKKIKSDNWQTEFKGNYKFERVNQFWRGFDNLVTREFSLVAEKKTPEEFLELYNNLVIKYDYFKDFITNYFCLCANHNNIFDKVKDKLLPKISLFSLETHGVQRIFMLFLEIHKYNNNLHKAINISNQIEALLPPVHKWGIPSWINKERLINRLMSKGFIHREFYTFKKSICNVYQREEYDKLIKWYTVKKKGSE